MAIIRVPGLETCSVDTDRIERSKEMLQEYGKVEFFDDAGGCYMVSKIAPAKHSMEAIFRCFPETEDFLGYSPLYVYPVEIGG